ncbi:FtsB family cell division protein [Agromyces mariniharenae]|nr:septum formation initiator family protein [Agromyces mariniharenae]
MQPDAPRPTRSSGVPRRPAVPGRPGAVPGASKSDAAAKPKPTTAPKISKADAAKSTAAKGAAPKGAVPKGAVPRGNAAKGTATTGSKASASKPAKGGAASAKATTSAKGSTSASASKTSRPARGGNGSTRPPRARSKARSGGAASTDRAGWLSGIRFSGFSLIMMGVLVLAVVVLAPTIAAFAQQRQQIAELRAAVSAQEAEVQRLRDGRERWNDETFIMTQARERLYYVMPGEVSYLVIDDRSEAAKADATAAVSAEVTESKGDWMRTLLDSVMTAGLAPAPTDPTDAPVETPADAPVGAPAEGSGR